MLSHFPCNPVIREWSWQKTQTENPNYTIPFSYGTEPKPKYRTSLTQTVKEAQKHFLRNQYFQPKFS